MDKFKRYITLSQLHLFGWLLVASTLASSVVRKNGGVSNYGNHYSTVIFYSLAFLVSCLYIYLAARLLANQGPRLASIVRILTILSTLLLLVFITTFPRRFGAVFSDIHDNVSKLLFAYEFVLSIWFVWIQPRVQSYLFLAAMVTGSLIGLLSSMHIVDLMFVGQMVGALGFALLLVATLPDIVKAKLR